MWNSLVKDTSCAVSALLVNLPVGSLTVAGASNAGFRFWINSVSSCVTQTALALSHSPHSNRHLNYRTTAERELRLDLASK
jgi:hypothetical protein